MANLDLSSPVTLQRFETARDNLASTFEGSERASGTIKIWLNLIKMKQEFSNIEQKLEISPVESPIV